MLRVYVAWVLILCGIFAVAMVGASAFGQRMDGSLLMYFTTNPTTRLLEFHLMDVDRHIDGQEIPLTYATTPLLANATSAVSGDGRVALNLCGVQFTGCAILLWHNGRLQTVIEGSDMRSSSFPTWSSDGRLAFQSCGDGTCSIMVWEDGSLQTITEWSQVWRNVRPIWNEQGQLAFSTCDTFDNCLVSVWDGSRVHTLEVYGEMFAGAPLWDHNGLLAFSNCDPLLGCDVLLWDGIALHNLTENLTTDERPIGWSSDGRLSISSCIIGGAMCDVLIWDTNGLQNLTNTLDEQELSPTWGTNGWLTYARWVPADSYQALMLWDGATTQPIFYQQVYTYYGNPIWNAAQQMVFVANSSNMSDLFLWDGESVRQLTQGTGIIGDTISWNTHNKLVFSICSVQFDDCDLMLWDGQSVAMLTDTPGVIEFSPIWVP